VKKNTLKVVVVVFGVMLLTEDQFEVFVQEDNTEMLKQAYREAIPLVVNLTAEVLPTSAPVIQSQVQVPVQAQEEPEERKVVVVLTGITGAGKSTTCELIREMVTQKGGKFHRVSADEKK